MRTHIVSLHLSTQNLHVAPQTIKTCNPVQLYMCMQILLGLPQPRQFSSLPHLQLLQQGIQCTYSQNRPVQARTRLSITPAILEQMRTFWSQEPIEHDTHELGSSSYLFSQFLLLRVTDSANHPELQPITPPKLGRCLS